MVSAPFTVRTNVSSAFAPGSEGFHAKRRDALDDVPLGEDTEDILLLFSFSLKYSFPNGSVVNPSNNMNSSQL